MPASSSSPSERQKLLLLGDSLTQFCFEGWGRQLANQYQRRADVLNRGMSGYNTRWFLRYAEDHGIWKEPGSVALVTLWFGANDAATLEQHVPLDEYTTNLGILIDMTKESYPRAKILLMAPPPVALEQRNTYLTNEFGDKAKDVAQRTSKVTGTYAEACEKVAKAKEIPCLNVFQAMTTAGTNDKDDDKKNENEQDETDNAKKDLSRFFCDGLHFSDAGHEFVSNILTEGIRTHFPSLEVRPCSITGQFNNSSSLCDDLATSGPYHDAIKSKRTWQEAFE